MIVVLVAKSCLILLWPRVLEPDSLLCPWDFPGKNTRMGCHFILQGIFQTRGQTHVSCIGWRILSQWATWEAHMRWCVHAYASHFSHIRIFTTLWTAAHWAPLSMGFSRQEYWSGLPCPPPGYLSMRESNLHLFNLLHCRFFNAEPPGMPIWNDKMLAKHIIVIISQHM